MVPVLGLLPQVSQPFLQLCFVRGDVVNDWPQVGKRVRWADPVVRGGGYWPECGSLNKYKRNKKYFIVLLLLRMKVK